MATIGRKRAIADIGPFEFSGLLAWLAWLVVHLMLLIGFRNKVVVMVQWFYAYVTFRRGARIIFGQTDQQDQADRSVPADGDCPPSAAPQPLRDGPKDKAGTQSVSTPG